MLPLALAQIASRLEFPKSMRWPQSPDKFARPVRWLLALFGSRPLKLAVAGVEAGATTRGRRFVHPHPLPVKSVVEYFKVMKKAGIVLDVNERREMISRQADRLATGVSGRVGCDRSGTRQHALNAVL